METNKRLLSLDTLRGADMCLIMGVGSLIVAICSLFPGGENCWLSQQMRHVGWEGLHIMDTVFPMFLFIAGISFPFSYAKQQETGRSRAQIYGKIFYRGIALVFLGLVYNGLFKLDFAHLRYPSVLARIGLAWMFAALLFINFKQSVRAVIAVVILVGYWLLLKFNVDPEAVSTTDPYSFDGNIVGYVDRHFLKGILWNGSFDPEGLLSTLPAIVTAMLGMFTGEFVRTERDGLSGTKKSLYMAGAAVVMLAVGLVWSLEFPIVKCLWTSTFVLVVGAYSLFFFALFYYIIDVRGWTGWTFPFKVIGMNSITIYLGQKIIGFGTINKFFFNGFAGLFPPVWGKLILSVGYVLVCWLFLYFLYRKKVFLKV